jgi:hypothetical protein
MTMEQNKILLLQTSPVIENSAKVDAVKKKQKKQEKNSSKLKKKRLDEEIEKKENRIQN